ncbi:MAG TPA: CvpA family protein [Burkholderiaceae bacterium]|nr:CvpA family protein [Burkholderiaceae bacterium]
MESLTVWDWLVVLICALSVLVGLVRGLVRTVFALGAWVAGLLGAPIVVPQLLPAATEFVPPWVVYVICFITLFFAVRLLGVAIGRGISELGLSGADRIAGGALGAVRAVAIIALVAVGAHLAGFSRAPAWQLAKTRPLLDAAVLWVEPMLPERVVGLRRI